MEDRTNVVSIKLHPRVATRLKKEASKIDDKMTVQKYIEKILDDIAKSDKEYDRIQEKIKNGKDGRIKIEQFCITLSEEKETYAVRINRGLYNQYKYGGLDCRPRLNVQTYIAKRLNLHYLCHVFKDQLMEREESQKIVIPYKMK